MAKQHAPAPVVETPPVEPEAVTDPNAARVVELEGELLKVMGELETSNAQRSSALEELDARNEVLQAAAALVLGAGTPVAELPGAIDAQLAEVERLRNRLTAVIAQRDEAQKDLDESGVAIVGLRNELDEKRRELATSEAGRQAIETQLAERGEALGAEAPEPMATADTSTPAFEDLPEDHPLKR